MRLGLYIGDALSVLAISTTKLRNDDLRGLRVRVFDIDRVLQAFIV